MRPRLRFTAHALGNLEKRKLSVEDVIRTIDEPDQVSIGATAVEYDKDIDGKAMHVVMVRGSDPPLVITVYDKNAEG